MTKINIQKRARLDSLSNNDNDDEEDNKEVDKNEEEKRLSIQGYSIELQNVNNIILPEDFQSFDNNKLYNII